MQMKEFVLENYLQQVAVSQNIGDCPKVPVPLIQKNQNYLFISYSHKDYKAVYSDLAHLYMRGVRFWYDKGLNVGHDWEQEVEDHIKNPNCCGIIFYISTNMFLSGSVFKEIEFTQKRKRGSIIYQKNYFCVNLHHGGIPDILFEAQKLQKDQGLPPLDTKAISVLTSTFSDKDTYIDANSRFYLDDLIDQIQLQFNVINKTDDSLNQSIFQSLDTPKAAWNFFLRGEIESISLFKYMYSCYRENKNSRPWNLLFESTSISIIFMLYAFYGLFLKSDIPVLQELLVELYKDIYLVGIILLLSIFFLIFKVSTLFLVFYLSPAYQKYQRKPQWRLFTRICFYCGSLFFAFFIPIGCLLCSYLFMAMRKGLQIYNREPM